MNIIPINNRVILSPSVSTMRGGLFVPEKYQGAATSCLVIERGKNVHPAIKKGDIVLCEVGFGDRENNIIEGTRNFICRDTNIYALVKNSLIFPLGRRVLLKRDILEKQVGSIVIPETRRTQSLYGTIERIGVSREHFKVRGIELGRRVRIAQWEPHIVEVTLEDGSYGIIVNENDLLFYED